MREDRCDLLCLDLPKAERLRAGRLQIVEAQRLAERAKALGDPTRLTLVAALAETDELCVCDLAWIVERAENLVSHHLRTLRSAGLVGSRRDGKMVLYSLTPGGRALLASLDSRPVAVKEGLEAWRGEGCCTSDPLAPAPASCATCEDN